MSVAWSRRRPEKPDEPGHPDHPFILAVVPGEPGEPERVTLAYRAVKLVPFAPPDELKDDVIEPTALFKPLILDNGDSLTITTEYDV